MWCVCRGAAARGFPYSACNWQLLAMRVSGRACCMLPRNSHTHYSSVESRFMSHAHLSHLLSVVCWLPISQSCIQYLYCCCDETMDAFCCGGFKDGCAARRCICRLLEHSRTRIILVLASDARMPRPIGYHMFASTTAYSNTPAWAWAKQPLFESAESA
jgi:hypothetical protein